MVSIHYSKQKQTKIHSVKLPNGKQTRYSEKRYKHLTSKISHLSEQMGKRIHNYYEINKEYTTIFIPNKAEDNFIEVKIDTEDLDRLENLHWFITRQRDNIAICADTRNIEGIKRTSVNMDRLLTNTVKDRGVIVKHIDGNIYSMRKSNLEVIKKSHRKSYKKPINNRTGYKGVSHDKKGKYNYYKATWYDLEGNHKSKSFNIDKYGEEKALKLAIEHRKLMEEKYNYK